MRLGVFLSLLFVVLCVNSHANAQGLSIIRDTEIERTLEKWIAPVLDAAGLSQNQVNVILVNSDEVNAFVAGGANIFIYAGLIQKAEYPEEVIGVMAHEVGHITGGHLIATRQAMERASFQSILGTVLGVGAAIATGDGGAAGAISVGGSGLAQRGFFSHSRVQESAADYAGIKYLNDAGMTAEGIATFLEKLEGQELLPASQQNEYVRTHPLTRDRINSVRNAVANETIAVSTDTSDAVLRQNEFDIIRAKLLAFREPQMVTRYYRNDGSSAADSYAYAIMHYMQRDYNASLEQLDDLIGQNPNNPYYLELKGQVLRDSGDLATAEQYYKRALDTIKGEAPLIQVALAHVMIGQQKNGTEVEELLTRSLQSDGRDAHAYRLLATLKGRNGQEAEAQYYLAEEATSLGRKREARRLVSLALNNDNALNANIRVKALDLKKHLDALPDDVK
jgi:predicted Zn-dependent protease